MPNGAAGVNNRTIPPSVSNKSAKSKSSASTKPLNCPKKSLMAVIASGGMIFLKKSPIAGKALFIAQSKAFLNAFPIAANPSRKRSLFLIRSIVRIKITATVAAIPAITAAGPTYAVLSPNKLASLIVAPLGDFHAFQILRTASNNPLPTLGVVNKV